MTYRELWSKLAKVYDEGEAKAIARMVFEVRYGLTMSDLLMGRDSEMPQEELEVLAARLECQEPVQYVLGQADFFGRSYHVEPGILIPRPETEHLCRLITTHAAKASSIPPKILDIGTGSGCIAITLALELSGSRVTAWDISPTALRVAKDNARRLGAQVDVVKNDMLQQTSHVTPQWNLIVSNPPYICSCEASQMGANVLNYEPETALFVPDDDPLMFYVPIMNYAQAALYPDGELWLETNPLYEKTIEERLHERGFRVIAHDDQFGKTRFIQAIR